MPAIHPKRHVGGAPIARIAIVAIAIIVALSGTIGTAAPASARNLSKVIASSRQHQIAAETAMRNADDQLKVLWQDLKSTRKKLKRTERKLIRVRARRKSVAADVARLQARLDDVLDDTVTPQPPADGMLPEEPGATTSTAFTVQRFSSLLPEESLTDSDSTRNAAGSTPVRSLRLAPDEVAALRLELKAEKTVLRKAVAKVGRVARAKRKRVRHINAIGRKQGSAIARRESAEQTLGPWIKSMTHLAKKRATKKAKLRPGRGSRRFMKPSNGSLSQGYHRGHDGLDIVKYKGAPIRASAVGVVAYVGWNPWDDGRRAFVVVIGHSTGYETIYGHLLPKRKVKVGQLVRKGQLIGFMGNTGHSTGPHVHWEVSRNWRTLNPAGVL